MEKDEITSAKILGLLRERHADLEWAFFTEVNTKGHGDRYIDAFAMNLWKSKKFRRIAYEIKISRADLLNEIDKNPDKREPAMALSNQFYYVVPHGLVEKKEIPEGCGLIEVNKGGLRSKVAAKFREVEPVTMAFAAKLIQRLKGYESPPFPIFKYAGRELTEEELRDLAKASRDRFTEREIRDKVDEKIKQWEKDEDRVQIWDYLLDEMRADGVSTWEVDLDKFKGWLKSRGKGVPYGKLERLKRHLLALKNDMSLTEKAIELFNKDAPDKEES